MFAVGHFVDARQVSKEAATAVALFNAVDPTPRAIVTRCATTCSTYMNSAATDDWSAARAGNLSGSANTEAYASSVQKKIEALPQDKDVEASNHYFVTEEILDLAKYRQPRLLHAVPEIPPVIWVVLYVSAFLFVGLTVFSPGAPAVADTDGRRRDHAAARRHHRRPDSARTHPTVGLGTSLQPVALNSALARLRAANPEPASLWAPASRCPPVRPADPR